MGRREKAPPAVMLRESLTVDSAFCNGQDLDVQREDMNCRYVRGRTIIPQNDSSYKVFIQYRVLLNATFLSY